MRRETGSMTLWQPTLSSDLSGLENRCQFQIRDYGVHGEYKRKKMELIRKISALLSNATIGVHTPVQKIYRFDNAMCWCCRMCCC